MNQSRENIFEYLDQLYGSNCFANLSKAVKVRNFLYKYISSNCGYRKVVKHVIEDALDFFFRRHYGVADEKADVNTREALYIAAHLCYRYQVEDSSLIQQVLEAAYDGDGNFDNWFLFLDPLAFLFEIESNLYPYKLKDDEGFITTERLGALEYFLHHARGIKKKRVLCQFRSEVDDFPRATERELSIVNLPLVSCRGCTPLLLASHSSDPRAVLLLLRYGADPLLPAIPESPWGVQFQVPLYVLVSKLNASVFWKSHNFHLDADVRREVRHYFQFS